MGDESIPKVCRVKWKELASRFDEALKCKQQQTSMTVSSHCVYSRAFRGQMSARAEVETPFIECQRRIQKIPRDLGLTVPVCKTGKNVDCEQSKVVC